ncbi:hypothetical protein A3A70_01540 [candidate division WWE3 bacterium RIFCSPLOWO2_01_FULL_42_11]|uniref:Uncharacterized protein n=1 Tax=candidate division WWE3 bacterium RIFCSPLOWO2_01_FULL_42_11 TaxID=1802627 RepID=A0A1F4VQV9_UNCKA|nr:MAG: hypothetical protein A3A70_01540 [candidate division WWE3 bacterium RIFCSPLOWO2_01_FULL_42_11]
MKPRLDLVKILLIVTLVIALGMFTWIPPANHNIVFLLMIDLWVLLSTACTLILHSHIKTIAEKHENKHAIFADSVRRGFFIGTCLSLVLLLKYLSLFTFPTLLLLILLIASLEYTITQHLIGFKSPKTQKTPEDMLQSVP